MAMVISFVRKQKQFSFRSYRRELAPHIIDDLGLNITQEEEYDRITFANFIQYVL